MASARSVAAQRAMRPATNLTIPKGGTSPLPKVAGGFKSVRNDHQSNRGAGDRASGRKGR